MEYVNKRRIHTAAERLVYEKEPIARIAEQVGITDVNYFTRLFKKYLGTTPTNYRKENKPHTENLLLAAFPHTMV